jgi:hypothetical protein
MPSCVRCVLQVSRTAEGSRPYLCNQFKLFGRRYYFCLLSCLRFGNNAGDAAVDNEGLSRDETSLI